MYCTKCGNRNDDSAKFCKFCGAEMKPPLPRQDAPAAQPAPAVKPPMPRGKVVAIVIACVVVVLALAAGAIGLITHFFLQPSVDPENPNPIDASADPNADAYDAYRQVVQNRIDMVGSASTYSMGPDTYASGTYLVDLLDMNEDGTEELLLGYRQDEADWIEIWSYRDGKVVCDFIDGVPSMHGTNGYFPYLEITPRIGGGYVINGVRCGGSSPTMFAYTLYGYTGDVFGPIAQRSSIDGSYGDLHEGLYSGEYDTPISQDEYDRIFDDVIGDNQPILHYHFFTGMGGGDGITTMDSLQSATSTAMARLGL